MNIPGRIGEISKDVIDFDDMGIIMAKSGVIFFDGVLILPDNIVKMGDQIFGHFHLVYIDFGLLPCEIFLIDFLAKLVKSPEIFLN